MKYDFCDNMRLFVTNGRCVEEWGIGKTHVNVVVSLIILLCFHCDNVCSSRFQPYVIRFIVLLYYTSAYNVKCNNSNNDFIDDFIDDTVYRTAPIKPTWKSVTECMFKHELSHKHQQKINDIDYNWISTPALINKNGTNKHKRVAKPWYKTSLNRAYNKF